MLQLINNLINYDFSCCQQCGACGVVCPKGAITMEPTEDGLKRIVVDDDKCITSDKSAYIIEPENSNAIANTIARIINNPQEAITIAASGHQVMKDTFSIDRVGLTFETFLNSLQNITH